MPSRNDARNDTAACPACGQPFTRAGRRHWCSDACRQAGWRALHPQPSAGPPAELPRPRLPNTVYECGTCGERYLGQQYCEDCRTFCRRIGPAGPCPHCDQPVTIQDISPTAR
jgi:endogenous inhibitor of DNA gyrase (YacG/DUF329 family)